MIYLFRTEYKSIIAVKKNELLTRQESEALSWLLRAVEITDNQVLKGWFTGPGRELITPWSTTAVEITRSMNIEGIERIEEFFEVSGENAPHDKMLQRIYSKLDQSLFDNDKEPERILEVTDIADYNSSEGLALSEEEIEYLTALSKNLGRPLTDSEVFGFSQVNSEHCRHKIFNGTFVIDGKEMESTLFGLIKKTSKINSNFIVSAYKDNCAFLKGPESTLFHPDSIDNSNFFTLNKEKTVISLKAETHNFPTTVEPFNGAATGSGGEIRDRIAGGRGAFPIAGTAVYMTSYPRLGAEGRNWELHDPREWLYQSPEEILIKASNGASDFGNKFGQPLICGSLLTFEHSEKMREYGYDKVIMLAGGVGYAKERYAFKNPPEKGDKIVLLGGDNFRIGMGGGAVSSVATGEYDNSIELNAIQRSNPEMQKRVYNAIRAMSESNRNTIVSVHDHGAGGHLNCFSELVEEKGGTIDISKLPLGDPTLSAKEIIGNESQERMGLVVKSEDVEEFSEIAGRESAPFYVVGEITGDQKFTFHNPVTNEKPIDLPLEGLFGSTPKTVIKDRSVRFNWDQLEYDPEDIEYYLEMVVQIESVACKDWLTNKVDRSVTGLIAKQQCAGEIQLPVNNLGVTAVSYLDKEGIATSIGHAPAAAMIDPSAGSRLAISESLTNIVWAPLTEGLKGVSLSANWMWPCRNFGEDSRLYNAVKAASDFAIELGINIPTGKDSLSMTQKYPDGENVLSPGTLIVSAAAECSNIRKVLSPVISTSENTFFYCLPFVSVTENTFALGGSAFAQVTNQLGNEVPDIDNPEYFSNCFKAVQQMVIEGVLLAGHDVSSGGLVTTLLEMNFPNSKGGMEIDLTVFNEKDPVRVLFSEFPGVVIQVSGSNSVRAEEIAFDHGVSLYTIGSYVSERTISLTSHKFSLSLDIDKYRDLWFKTSYLLDTNQTGEELAFERYQNYKEQPLKFRFPENFTGKISAYGLPAADDKSGRIPAAIIREKGSNGDREMAWIMHLAGFSVKDVHMTDLISGRETLEDVRMIVFVGGFSNADTLGSARGWAGAFRYNQMAQKALDRFYSREDTLSLGVCNGCQLMAELNLLTAGDESLSPKMLHNESHKFESSFTGVTVEKSPSVMLSSLAGYSLGIWVAHGEGRFSFPAPVSDYNIALRYNYDNYPGNPNGSPERVAGLCSRDGRHLAVMPHPERALYPHNWAYYPQRETDEVTPWIEMFVNAFKWLKNK